MRALPAAAFVLVCGAANAGEPMALTFSTTQTPEWRAAKGLMEAERGEPIDDAYVQIALVDLDRDGTAEVFAFADSSYFCGSAGCIPRIYRQAAGDWVEIPIGWDDFINGEPDMWSADTGNGTGWLTLVLTEDGQQRRFQWDGESYAEVE